MKRSLAILVAAVSLLGSAPAFAQEAAPGAGRAVITIIPAGGTFFTEGKDLEGPSFGNYDIGGAVAFNFNRYVGVEGEVSGALGVSQSLQFAGTTADRTTPHLLNYSGNLVVSAPNRTSVVPYLTGGVGGLSLFEKEDLGITLVSDPQKTVLQAYGAYGPKKLYGKEVVGVIRSTFVVDAEGRIEKAAYNVKATGHVAKLRRDLGLG